MANLTDLELTPRNLYFLVPLAWTNNVVTILSCSVLIMYLKAKPPLSQTVMDYANTVCFGSAVPFSLLLSIIVTVVSVFDNCGEMFGSVVGYLTPATEDNLNLQFAANFIVQGLIVQNPSLLESQCFEKITKFAVTVAVPVYSLTLYSTLYLLGVKTGYYIIIRGAQPQISTNIWVLFKGSSILLFFLAFAIIRLWIGKKI